jgi:hypothetical protein
MTLPLLSRLDRGAWLWPGVASLLVLVALCLPRAAAAAEAPPIHPRGVAVVAYPGATDAAWALARAVYARSSLLPEHLDEATARVLCGEAPPAPLADLAETVAGLRGEDAASRILLGNLAHRLALRAVVTVRVEGGHPLARVYLPDSSTFDAATYAPDDAPPSGWSGAVSSLERTYATAPEMHARVGGAEGPVVAPDLATHPVRPGAGAREQPGETAPPFYKSPWFWGAVGAAVLAGGGLYFATRDSGPSTIHLQLQVR